MLTPDYVTADAAAIASAKHAIRAILPASQAEIALRIEVEEPPHPCGKNYARAMWGSAVERALREMVGPRVGRETSGELVIIGWRSGSEIYAPRDTARAVQALRRFFA